MGRLRAGAPRPTTARPREDQRRFAKGKKQYDKRETEKERDWEREGA